MRFLETSLALAWELQSNVTFCTDWGSNYIEGGRIPIVVRVWVAHRDSSFFPALCSYAIRAKFTAEWIKNSREARRKNNLPETCFRLCKKEKTRNYWCLRRMGRDKALYNTEGHKTMGAWVRVIQVSIARAVQCFSFMAKIALWIEAFPPWPLTIVALVINRQRAQRGWPAAEMTVCSQGNEEENSPLWWSDQVAESRWRGKSGSEYWRTGEECRAWPSGLRVCV